MSVKNKFKEVIGKIIKEICVLLHIEKYSVVVIEGGITSQLEQYILGKRLGELGCTVRYDLSAYINGKSFDCLGRDSRNLDLQKLDTNIVLPELSKRKTRFYKRFFSISNNIIKCQEITSDNIPKEPAYYGGYGYGLYSETEFEIAFRKYIHINPQMELFGEENEIKLEEILSEENSIGMHVRRGDVLLPSVGRPIPKVEYYLKALENFDKSSKIYIFTDDKEWVREKLIPLLNYDCRLVDINDSDKGWCDLILMSACRNQIKSPCGGLGRDAYRLNEHVDKKVVIPCYVAGNMSQLQGNIIEIVIDDSICDMSNVYNTEIRL